MKNKLLKQYFILFFTCILFADNTFANTFSVSFDTTGFVYGQFSRILRVGMRNSAVNGEIRLGYESSFGSTDKSTLVSKISPQLWQFCFDKDDYAALEQLVGQYVILEYKTPKRSSLLTCSASNELVAIYPVANRTAIDTTVLSSNDFTELGASATGVEFGRFVHAFASKQRSRTHFLTLQVGNNGNQFRDYFTQDSELFDFAVKCLNMGLKVKLQFIERLQSTLARKKNNRLHILKIEILDAHSGQDN